MHFDLVIKNGTLVSDTGTYKAGIAVKDGKIIFTGEIDSSSGADEIFDAQGLYVLPGLIDAHVHFRDPGLTEKEDFETGSAAAAAGGITCIADMPNVLPVTSTVERFNEKIKIAKEKSYIDFALFSLLTNDNKDEMDALKKAGAIGYKVFLGTSTGDISCPDEEILLMQMRKSAALGMRIGFHAEDSVINAASILDCKKNPDAYPARTLSNARPVSSEVSAIKKIFRLVKDSRAKIHIHHVTSRDGIRLIKQIKEDGIDISCETCPHYLLLNTDKDIVKVYPPIRDEYHRKGLWEALDQGVIDMLASDHAPHTVSEKEKGLWEEPGGITGVETIARLMLNEVNKGSLSLNAFVRLMSARPAKIWGMYPRKGSLIPGADADISIIDMNKKEIIKKENLHSKNKTCVYDNYEVQGCPSAVIVRGKFVMRYGELTGKRGEGVLISPVS
jgi:dihydroorotase